MESNLAKITEFNLWIKSSSSKEILSIEMLFIINAGNNCGKHSATSSVVSGFIKNSHKMSKICLCSSSLGSYSKITQCYEIRLMKYILENITLLNNEKVRHMVHFNQNSI